ncbi:hypothetical protein Tsubulata_002543, partial [Turnera subulata]
MHPLGANWSNKCLETKVNLKLYFLVTSTLSSGNSKVMKHQWYGKCFYIYTSSIHQIGTTGVQCLPFCFSMELPLQFSMLFYVHYLVLCLLCIPRMYKYYIHTKDRSAKRLAKLYLGTVLMGSLCWLLDRALCDKIDQWYFNPEGHALWHFLEGFSTYFANTFLMFCRAEQLQWNPKVDHLMGILPYVKIQKQKTR